MRRVPLLIAALLALAGCQRGAPPTVDEVPRGTSTHTVDAGGQTREFRLFVPSALPLTSPVPLVVMLHGGFGSAEQAERSYGWNAEAERHGFVVAYPNGLNRAWSVGDGCCGQPGRRGTDDVAFIVAAVSSVRDRLPIDPARVFATGMSNGAMMSYRLACESTTFAAVAPVAGTLMGACAAPKDVSLLHIHGLADESVPFDGSQGNGPGRIDGADVPSTVDIWLRANGCSTPAVTTDDSVTTSRATCPAGREVVLITIGGVGHLWPDGRDRAPGTLDATATIWEFFAAHPRT